MAKHTNVIAMALGLYLAGVAQSLAFSGQASPSVFGGEQGAKSKSYDASRNFKRQLKIIERNAAHHPHRHRILPKDTLTIGLSSPYFLDVSEKTNKVYVANYGNTYDIMDFSMSVIDGATNRIEAVVSAGHFPSGLSVNESTNKVYIANGGSGTATIIDGKTNSMVSTIPLGSGPTVPEGCGDHGTTGEPCTGGAEPIFAVVNEKTNRIYVALFLDNGISVIDGNTDREIAVIPTGINPYILDVNKKTNKIYVANTGGGVTVIDGATNTVLTSIPLSSPFGVAVNDKTNTIYVTSSATDELYVIDGTTDTVVDVVPVSGFPIGVTVNEDTNTIYVAKTFEDSIIAMNGNTKQIIGEPIPTGAGPFDVNVNRKTNTVYVLNLFDGTITILGGRNLHVAGISQQQPVPLRVPIRNIGVLQLAIHDLYNVDRTTEVDSEDFELNLSTVLDHGEANIANGGESRNKENPMTFTVAKKFGQMYLDLIRRGKGPAEARQIVIKHYLDAVRQAYETTFYEQFPLAEPFDAKDATLTGDLALRTLHDLIPGKIFVNGVLTPILDPSLVGRTLSDYDMMQVSSQLDGQYDPEFRDMINPMNGEHIDLLERDRSFATQFHTRFLFEELQAALVDGKYDPHDQVMRIIRSEFGFGQ